LNAIKTETRFYRGREYTSLLHHAQDFVQFVSSKRSTADSLNDNVRIFSDLIQSFHKELDKIDIVPDKKQALIKILDDDIKNLLKLTSYSEINRALAALKESRFNNIPNPEGLIKILDAFDKRAKDTSYLFIDGLLTDISRISKQDISTAELKLANLKI